MFSPSLESPLCPQSYLYIVYDWLQVHEARKTTLMSHALTSRKERSESAEKAFSEKFQKRYADMAKREHEDHLRHFQVRP